MVDSKPDQDYFFVTKYDRVAFFSSVLYLHPSHCKDFDLCKRIMEAHEWKECELEFECNDTEFEGWCEFSPNYFGRDEEKFKQKFYQMVKILRDKGMKEKIYSLYFYPELLYYDDDEESSVYSECVH